jgi:hypothetical protein
MKSTEPVLPGIGGSGAYQMSGRADRSAGVGAAVGLVAAVGFGAPLGLGAAVVPTDTSAEGAAVGAIADPCVGTRVPEG